jgi:hypothetical protein
MKSYARYLFYSILLLQIISCRKKTDESPDKYPHYSILKINFKLDSLQERLDNYGNISSVPAAHGSMSPQNPKMRIGFVELLTDSGIQPGDGARIFGTGEVIASNDTGYQCCQGFLDENQTYQYLLPEVDNPIRYYGIRIYFSYQHFDVNYTINDIQYSGSVAAFLAKKSITYYFEVKDSVYTQYSLKQNGEWYFEVDTPGYGIVQHGTAFTASPNVLFQSVPTEANSCVVTCPISPVLIMDYPMSKTITISISTNHSFEWVENSTPGIFEPFDGDSIYDIGIRGVKVIQ